MQIITKLKLGYCTFSTPEFGKINFTNDTSSGYVEGSQISFYCNDNRNEPVVATCMKNGSWSPDPHMYNCQEYEQDVTCIII